MKKPRKDSLATEMDWRKYWRTWDGCEHSESCLTCPLAECVEFDRLGAKQKELIVRRQEIWDLWKKGIPVKDLSKRFNLSDRSLYREIQQGPPSESALQAAKAYLTTSEPSVSAVRAVYKARKPLPAIKNTEQPARTLFGSP